MLSRRDSLDAIERAAHFVRDHGGAGNDAIDHALVYELGDQSRDAFVQVRAATCDYDDFAASTLGLGDSHGGRAKILRRPWRER
jgi:hypothetical protein